MKLALYSKNHEDRGLHLKPIKVTYIPSVRMNSLEARGRPLVMLGNVVGPGPSGHLTKQTYILMFGDRRAAMVPLSAMYLSPKFNSVSAFHGILTSNISHQSRIVRQAKTFLGTHRSESRYITANWKHEFATPFGWSSKQYQQSFSCLRLSPCAVPDVGFNRLCLDAAISSRD
jgi:hypothetical protein